MALSLVNTFNMPDDALTRELDGVQQITTAVVDGTTYVFAAGQLDDGVSVFRLNAGGTLSTIDSVDDSEDIGLKLDGVRAVTTAKVGDFTYLYAGSQHDNGISVFRVGADGSLTTIDNESDADGNVFLNSVAGLTTAVVGGQTYLYAAGFQDSGLTVFTVNGNGSLTALNGLGHASGIAPLHGADAVDTAVVDGTTYLFSTAANSNALSVFAIDTNGDFTAGFTDSVTDSGPLELQDPRAVASAKVGNKTFVFAGSTFDEGLSVFEVSAAGELANAFNVSDDDTLMVGGVLGLSTAKIAGTTYLFATGHEGVSVFAVAADGSLVNMANVADTPMLNLDTAFEPTVATVGGVPYLIVSSQGDSGLSVFRIDTTGHTINGTGGNDTINAANSAPGKLLPSDLGDVISGLGGNDTIGGLDGADKIFGGSGRDTLMGDGGNDLIAGGAQRDVLFGGAGADDFDFNSIKESKKGAANRDTIQDFKRGQDDIDLRGIDAKTGVGGNNKFKFIGKDDFSGTKGELHFKDLGAKCLVQGDVNGDGKADFEIFVKAAALTAGDFVL